MRQFQAVLITVNLLLGTAELACAAAPKVVWSEKAERFATPSGMRLGAAVVDDAAASGGKAVRMPCEAGAKGSNMLFSAPRMEMRGQVLFTFWLRAENLPPLTPGFMVTLVAHDKRTGQWAFHRQTRVYGANLQSQGYTPVTLALDAPWSAETYGPEVILQWDAPPKDVAPVMYLDKAEISAPVLDAPRVQEYVARQFIDCGKVMGFAGVRLDVRYLEVYPGERGFDGKEVAATYPEADRISAAAVKRIKSLVHKELPEFTFGYNYASPEEVKDMMETFKERCEGGAWMLDELPCTYQQKSSPYHVWKAYVRRMMSWGDRVNRLGGVYNPYDFKRGSMEYPIDLIYSAIFRVISGGRDYGGWYYNSRQPVGDLGAFTTRFSEFLHNADRNWIAEVRGEVDVRSAAPLWWRDMCFWTRASDGRKCLQVNLVNPPKAAEVMENPRSEINPPVRDVTVICAPSGGQVPTAAYLLTSEPFEPAGLNEVQAVKLDLSDAGDGRVAVTVPSVLFWKMVVFEFKEP